MHDGARSHRSDLCRGRRGHQGAGQNGDRVAKTAPDHIYRLDSSNWLPIMGDSDVVELWGVGKRTAARLAAHDLRAVADLAVADRDEVAAMARELCADIKADGREVTRVGVTVRTRSFFT